MAQNTTNSQAFIEAEQYSSFILRNLHDGLLPSTMYRNVTDFPSGSTLNIKTIGSVTIQDGAEDQALVSTPIDSNTITFKINRYKGDSWHITDELREEGSQVEALMAARASESTRAIQEVFESDFLQSCWDSMDAKDTSGKFSVNGFQHLYAASGGNDTLSLEDISYMKLAFDKANVPMAGRIMIVDPIAATVLQNQVTLTGSDISPISKSMIETGFARDHNFLFNIFGFDIITSNRLPTVSSYGTYKSDGTTSKTASGIVNIAMCIADDNTRPMMGAWRRMPKVETERIPSLRRDVFYTTCRYGFGCQRLDTMGCIISSATATKAN